MTAGAITTTISRSLPVPTPGANASIGNTGDHAVRKQVQQVLQNFRQGAHSVDRRSDRREPFPYPIYITPTTRSGEPETDQTIVVLGKHLSERGLDFYYSAPIPYRRVIASWECPNGCWLAMVLDLRWCRSTRHGWYENGGRFLHVTESPLGKAAARPESLTGAAN